jgi:diguanylate cyclase (GGDEF)-like protein
MSVRARLVVLALVAALPLMMERSRQIEAHRAERISALSNEAHTLARQGAAAQQEAMVAVKAITQVVARAQATPATSPENCAAFLRGAMADAQWITGLSVIDAKGRVTCSTTPTSVGLDITDRPYFEEAVRARTFIIAEQAIERQRGRVRLVAAVPILAEDGSPNGIITAGFELRWIDRVASELTRRPGAMMLIVDDAGMVLSAHPSEPKWLRKKLDAQPLLDALLEKREGIAMAAGPDGARRAFGFAPLPDTNTFIAIGLDEADLLQRVGRETQIAYLQFAFVALIVLFGVWFGGEQMIVRPLRELARMAAYVGHGNLRGRASRHRWAAEFAPLATALDVMSQRLAEREEELRVANAHLDKLVRQDGLSGLANRRGFDLRLEHEWRASARTGLPLALIMIDVDHFKAFNDHYGHVAGDICLRTVADALAKLASNAAVVARYGGEEFALLFSATSMNGALEIAEAVRREIEALRLRHQGAPSGHVTASFGVAALTASADDSPQMLIEAADAALYAAKRRGRNTVSGHGAVKPLFIRG